jgi:ABC-2 type transport system permease protein
MSATTATIDEAAVRPAVTTNRVTQLRVIRSEWTKLWSLRSTRWTLGISILGMAGLGPLIAAIQMNRWDHMGPGDRLHFNPINTGLGGYHFAQLAIGVLGVLVLSGEYTTGQIRSSFMAVPKRLPVL